MFVLSVLEAPNTKTNSLCVQTHLAIKLFLILILISDTFLATKDKKIKHVTSSAYHPESQGALERFHQTLKSMLSKYCTESGRDGDEGLPLLLFAVCESVQESLGFSPTELVFGHTVRGPLKMLQDNWISNQKLECNLLN